MIRPTLGVLAVSILFCFWVWPVPRLDAPAFSTHMAMHMAVVAIAAPLLGLAIAGGRWDPVSRAPRLVSALPASLVELIAVWLWHTPVFHHAARHQPLAAVAEQGCFLLAGVYLWVAALGGSTVERHARAFSGLCGLLLTSMHMTLLGALIALTPRVLFHHAGSSGVLTPLEDQQLGGAIMLGIGGMAYLIGGVALAADALLHRQSERERT